MPVGSDPALVAVLMLVRIGITIFCVVQAGSLKRSKLGWGLFGFFVPVVAFVVILFIKPKPVATVQGPSAASLSPPKVQTAVPVLPEHVPIPVREGAPTVRQASLDGRNEGQARSGPVTPPLRPAPPPFVKPSGPSAAEVQRFAQDAVVEQARVAAAQQQVADIARQSEAEAARQRELAAFPRRPDWAEFKEVLDAHGISKFYHFTDRANLESIKLHGGLYSWAHCEQNGIQITRPGGNGLSRSLDTRDGLQDYVRLSFYHDPLMLFIAKRDGRIVNPVILEVDPDVIYWEATRFCDGNATANIAQTGGALEDLNRVRFDIIKRGRWDGDLEKHYLQAEVLVRTHVPARLIRNLA